MSSRLIDRVRNAQQNVTGEGTGGDDFARIKGDLHKEIVGSLDFEQVRKTPREELKSRLRRSLSDTIQNRQLPLNRAERDRMVDEILDEITGLGPLEPLLEDDSITDILINGPDTVYVERNGRLERAQCRFNSEQHLMQIIDRVVSQVGRRIDESNPMVDARLADGSRFNAIIPPLALDGPMVSIRRFGHRPLTSDELVQGGSIPKPMLDLLHAATRARLNILVSGGTGSGKTTLLNCMSGFIPDDQRIVTIEDAAELQLQQRHVVRLETRPPNLEGNGRITAEDLLRNALRMRPDRIIVGEIRGVEAVDMLQAMNTGHDGSMSTVHANSSRDALSRVETMVGMGMPNTSDQRVREIISRALDLIVHLDRLPDGSRRVMGVTEVAGMEGNVITTQDIFTFEQSGVDEHGRVYGHFQATGVRPTFASKLARAGIQLPPELFRYRKDVP
ncbi:MAG: CpaF family protein [Myxococcota bacterium]|nr:CpaF family protein [Myxococcota bacterium]MEC9390696.1 CpaF family protein [Myxococcota bacterium]